MIVVKQGQGRNIKWEDMVAAPEAEEVIEAVVREDQAVHAVAVPEEERRVNRLRVVIIVLIMTEPADYIPAIQVIKILVPKVPGILGLYFR